MFSEKIPQPSAFNVGDQVRFPKTFGATGKLVVEVSDAGAPNYMYRLEGEAGWHWEYELELTRRGHGLIPASNIRRQTRRYGLRYLKELIQKASHRGEYALSEHESALAFNYKSELEGQGYQFSEDGLLVWMEK
jgi:hypothetical protein